MDFMGIGQGIAGLIQTGLNWGVNQENLKHQKEVFEAQKRQQEWQNNFSMQQFEYQKEQNDLTRQREDNAVQRRVKDLQASGINPLTVAGGQSASSQVTTGSSMSGGTAPTTAPQLEQIQGLDQVMQGVMNVLTQRQNIAQSQTDQAYTEEKTRTERDRQENIQSDTKNKDASTKEIERKTQYYDDLSSKTEAEIKAIEKENELRELRKETERAKAYDTWQTGHNKYWDRYMGQSTATKTGERSYYGITDGSALIQGGGLLGNTAQMILRKIFGK